MTKKKEVALDLTFEHHLLARPSLAGNERTKMKKKAALKNKKKATSRNNFNFIFLRVSHLFVTQKMHKAYFGGKQANCANFSKENLLRQDKYQCPREANLKKQKLITSLLQTIVEGQWRYG